MKRVVLKGSPACQWNIGSGMKSGGTVLKLTDEELKYAKKNCLIESFVDVDMGEKPKEKVKKSETFSEKELFKMNKEEQIELLNKLGAKKIPRLEKSRVKEILKLQESEARGEKE